MQSRFSPEQLADPDTAVSEKVIRKCVHCGFCLATCPTYLLNGDERDSPRGRIYLIKDMLEGGKPATAEVVRHVDRCLSCLACETTCPSGVSYRRLVDHGRRHIEETYRRPWFERLLRSALATVLPSRGLFRAARGVGRMAGAVVPRPIWPKRLRPLIDLAAKSDLPGRAFGPHDPADATRGSVVLMRGCVEPALAPRVQAAAEVMLAIAGYAVVRADGEGCCGALTHHMGRETAAMAMARRNIDAWCAALDQGAAYLVTTASGCGSVIKDYGHLLREDPDYVAKAARVASAAKDIVEVLDEAGLPAPAAAPGGVIAYQSSCSLQHGQQIREAPRRLLERAGYRVTEPQEAHLCCGSAGAYNILQPELAAALQDRKLGALKATGAQGVASGNVGCLVQLSGHGLDMAHTVEWLAAAYAPAAFEAPG